MQILNPEVVAENLPWNALVDQLDVLSLAVS